MISIARKNLFAEKLRLLISVGGVIFSSFLVLVLLGIYVGITIQITKYVNKTQADLWIMEEGTRDMFHSLSLLPDNLKNKIERKIGSGRVYRLITRATQLKVREKGLYETKRKREKEGKADDVSKAVINLVGFDTATGVGGPWKIKIGKQIPGKNEVIIDEMLSKNKKINLGDNVEILNENFTVVGISQDTNLITEQMVFTNFEDAQDLFNFKGRVNYYLVSLDNSQTISNVRERIENEIPKVLVKTKRQFADANAEMINESFIPIIFTIVVIGLLVGAVVVGLTIYTATMEKTREYGILKAIGAKNRLLYRIVFEQSIWIVLFGFIGGIVLTYLSIPYIEKYAAIAIILTPKLIFFAFGATIVMSIVASYIPVRKIAGIDPVMVFKS